MDVQSFCLFQNLKAHLHSENTQKYKMDFKTVLQYKDQQELQIAEMK